MYEVRRPPAHAGRLRPWEQCVFALVFAVMAMYVLVVSVSAARANYFGAAPSGRSAAPAGSPASGTRHGAGSAAPGTAKSPPAVQKPGTCGSHPSRPAPAGTGAKTGARLDCALAAALAPLALSHGGTFAVGIVDETTGAEAVYHGGRYFHAASVENADMLAALLLQHQQAGAPLSDYLGWLAGAMMEHSDNDAANALWDAAGGQSAMQAANRLLGLRHTNLGADGYWGLTSTTVTDQLRLLADLTSARSPLHAAARRYALGLMEQAAAGQRWGVSAAASQGAGTAVRNGWMPDPLRWVINSIGVVRHHGQELLIAVLSKDNASEASGIALVRAAATTAMRVITQAR